jgi:hypothetical protein
MTPNSVLKGVLLMAACFAVTEVGLLVRDVRNSSKILTGSIQEILKNTNETILFTRNTVKNVNVVVARVKVATHSWEAASNAQTGYFERLKADSAQTIGKLNTLADSLNALVQNTDTSVNRVLVPKVDAAIEETTATIKSANAGVMTATDGVKVALTDIHAILADPSIPRAISAIAESGANTERMTASGAKSAEYIEGYLSPKKMGFWMKLVQFLIPNFSIDLR